MIVSYTCKNGAEHTIPSDEVRVLKNGDGNFMVACDCSEEPLDESHERPHLSTDHFSHIDGREIPADDWLALDDVSDDWYDVNPWLSPEGFEGTRLQRREKVRKLMKERADSDVAGGMFADTEEKQRHEQARKVPCPDCGANAGTKCERPSGHSVRKSHSDRIDVAMEEGILMDDDPEGPGGTGGPQKQSGLEEWA